MSSTSFLIKLAICVLEKPNFQLEDQFKSNNPWDLISNFRYQLFH